MKPSITDFDPSAYLDNDQLVAEYLSQVMADGDTEEFLAALGHIAKARGMTWLARNTNLGRESLYKALSQDGNPEFATVLKVMKALGLRLSALPA